MSPWRCLLKLHWLTGEDGRIAFWKLAYLLLLGAFFVVLWHVIALVDHALARDDALRDATALLWPVMWNFALFLLLSFGIKGAQLWAQTARLRTDAAFRVTQEHKVVDVTVTQRRDAEAGLEPA